MIHLPHPAIFELARSGPGAYKVDRDHPEHPDHVTLAILLMEEIPARIDGYCSFSHYVQGFIMFYTCPDFFHQPEVKKGTEN